jgi:protein SCO1/2
MTRKNVFVPALALVLALAAAACAPEATPAPTVTDAPPTAAASLPTATAMLDTAVPVQPSLTPAPATATDATAVPATATFAVDDSQTTAVAGRLQSIAATRAAQQIQPTAPPTRAANATQSVSALATAFGPEVAAASQGISLGTVINPPLLVRDFTLPASTGEDLSIHDLDGRYRMIFFGYLHCPDFCPLTMAEFRQVKALLGDLASEVQFIYISVDGARDTPQLVANYLDNFDPEFIGFSGDDATLARIQPDYGFYYQRRLDTGSQAEYIIDHSTRSYLLDREGRLVSSFTYDTEPEVIAAALRWFIENEAR